MSIIVKLAREILLAVEKPIPNRPAHWSPGPQGPWFIYDTQTKKVVRKLQEKQRARSTCAKMNLDYGAVRYTIDGVGM